METNITQPGQLYGIERPLQSREGPVRNEELGWSHKLSRQRQREPNRLHPSTGHVATERTLAMVPKGKFDLHR